jgi:hypothetical protein
MLPTARFLTQVASLASRHGQKTFVPPFFALFPRFLTPEHPRALQSERRILRAIRVDLHFSEMVLKG